MEKYFFENGVEFVDPREKETRDLLKWSRRAQHLLRAEHKTVIPGLDEAIVKITEKMI